MEQINSLDDSTVSLSSPTSSIGKKRKPGPKSSASAIFNEDPSKLLALYAATSSMSLCHIENPYLKELLSMIPGFQVPTRRALAGMINRQCEKTMNDIRERVRKSPAKISISADIATTKGMRRSYLGVAVHFFCDESKSLRVAALDMVEMEERHTGPAIAEV
uniref:Uncharacterized protein n=1 Tax=Ditylenchus dipsaci TaxID=166011 RepID=A0A915EH57_9BILA